MTPESVFRGFFLKRQFVANSNLKFIIIKVPNGRDFEATISENRLTELNYWNRRSSKLFTISIHFLSNFSTFAVRSVERGSGN